jgi:hypothetical protein
VTVDLTHLAAAVLIGLAGPQPVPTDIGTSTSPTVGGWVCSGHAQPPVQQSGILRANAFQSCTGDPGWRQQRLVVEIQRRRYGFIWQTMASEDSGLRNDAFVERTAFYKCLGTGNFVYRTVAIGSVANGTYTSAPVASLSTVDVTC